MWNLFLPESDKGAGLSNLDYAPLCEIMGRSPYAPEVFNCNAPDTGNMEVFERYASEELKEKWLTPLLKGEIRSGFAMTEPQVASSDATNIEASIKKEDNEYIINGKKWWTSGAMDPRCKVLIFMGKTDPNNSDKHKQQSQIVVPMDTPGIKVERYLPVFGFTDAPHGHAEVSFTDVKVPKENMLSVTGMKGPFSCLNSARLGISFGALGAAQYCLEKAIDYSLNRRLFNELLAEKQLVQMKIANMASDWNLALLASLHVADMVDANNYHPAMISLIKRNSCSKALNIARESRDILGGNGITEEYEIFRHMTNLETVNTYEGTYDIHSLIMGNYITGYKAF